MAPAEGQSLRIEVIYCPGPGAVDRVSLQLPPGATVGHALAASGLPGRHGMAPDTLRTGVWCKIRPLDTPLRDLDRVELYRPLQVDPKEARRQRYRGQLRKSASTTTVPE